MKQLMLTILLLLSIAVVAPHAEATGRPHQAGRQPPTLYRQTIFAEDTFWSGEVRVEGGVTVAPQATLTVAAGTVVRFVPLADGRPGSLPALLVQGRLVVNGTADLPVQFVGIDLEPGITSWQGVMLVGSEKNNLFNNLRIKGAKVGVDALFSRLQLRAVWADRCGIGIRGQDALLDIQGGVVSGCGTGLQLHDSEVALRGGMLQGNRMGVMSRRGSLLLQDLEAVDNELDGLQATGSRLSVEGSRLLRNGNGIVAEGCEGMVKGNRVVGQRGHGVVLTGSRLRLRDNEVSGNGSSGLVVRDGKGVAFANSLHSNGQFDLLNEGQEEFRAPGNWWGGKDPMTGKRVGGTGSVIVEPLLQQAPPGI